MGPRTYTDDTNLLASITKNVTKARFKLLGGVMGIWNKDA